PRPTLEKPKGGAQKDTVGAQPAGAPLHSAAQPPGPRATQTSQAACDSAGAAWLCLLQGRSAKARAALHRYGTAARRQYNSAPTAPMSVQARGASGGRGLAGACRGQYGWD